MTVFVNILCLFLRSAWYLEFVWLWLTWTGNICHHPHFYIYSLKYICKTECFHCIYWHYSLMPWVGGGRQELLSYSEQEAIFTGRKAQTCRCTKKSQTKSLLPSTSPFDSEYSVRFSVEALLAVLSLG